MVIGAPKPGFGEVGLTNFDLLLGDELAAEDELDGQYRAADREIEAIRRKEDNDDLNRLFTSRSGDDYKGAKDRYLSLLMERKPKERRNYADGDEGFFDVGDVAPIKSGRIGLPNPDVPDRPLTMVTPYGAKGVRGREYDDPYSDITADVQERVDDLLNRANDAKNQRSSEDRQNAITGLVTKLTGGRPNYSAIREQIKTPSYESYMGGANTMQRAGKLMAGVRDAAEARRPQEAALLDSLIAKANADVNPKSAPKSLTLDQISARYGYSDAFGHKDYIEARNQGYSKQDILNYLDADPTRSGPQNRKGAGGTSLYDQIVAGNVDYGLAMHIDRG